MRKARLRALTRTISNFVGLLVTVEMRKARLRALTPFLLFTIHTFSPFVEMRKARLRALTRLFPVRHRRYCHRRNEESPIEGIDTYKLEVFRCFNRFVEMRKARLRALTPAMLEASSTTSSAVEMRKARLRALTLWCRLRVYRIWCSRNEESPIEGIDTCHEQTHGSGSSL